VLTQKEDGYWTCEAILPKGENIYKFIVNDQYLADNKNFMHVGDGAKSSRSFTFGEKRDEPLAGATNKLKQ
jgi:hypothetical protein